MGSSTTLPKAAQVLLRKRRPAAGTPLKRFRSASMRSNGSWPAGRSPWAASGSIFTPSYSSLTDALFRLRSTWMEYRKQDGGQQNPCNYRQRNICADRVDARQKHFDSHEHKHAGDPVVQILEHVE